MALGSLAGNSGPTALSIMSSEQEKRTGVPAFAHVRGSARMWTRSSSETSTVRWGSPENAGSKMEMFRVRLALKEVVLPCGLKTVNIHVIFRSGKPVYVEKRESQVVGGVLGQLPDKHH
jgi:hypothetical protein